MDSELRIDDGHCVVAHLAGSYRVVERLSFGANEVGDFCVRLGGGAWVQFFAAEFCEWLLVVQGAAKASRLR